ncbi:hypothetical protein [Ferroacidibacillus organovorans]|uniref:Uncharacterized protein n=1 Tax=Ferroacidibacillus organovorans TaxID=1765683 RepID=A0A853KB58_9BACL|nr:hypothetical protein [Ferroacidibacillus organovorans]KYP80343.1 hypothetical protein AYJ22_11500 [Ferroacidibacillus organovorans]OAG93349.1 hypothetical protein AYW79_11160 [Ferroacidibacillus organovorans]
MSTGTGTVFNAFTVGGVMFLAILLIYLPNQSIPSVSPVVSLKARNFLRLSLASLWITDGILQAQPAMFSARFLQEVLRPMLTGEPNRLRHALETLYGLWGTADPLWNALATLVQLSVGAALFSKWEYVQRLGTRASLVWSLIVWAFGEAFGGIFAPGTSFIAGGPGSAFVYALMSALLLFGLDGWMEGRAIRTARKSVALLFFAGAAFQTSPPFWNALNLAGQFASTATATQPVFFAGPLFGFVDLVYRNPVAWNAFFTVYMLFLGMAWWHNWRHLWIDWLSILWLAFEWWFGQGLGELFSGVATDPNSAVPIALLMMAAGMNLKGRTRREKEEKVRYIRERSFRNKEEYMARLHLSDAD